MKYEKTIFVSNHTKIVIHRKMNQTTTTTQFHSKQISK